MNSEDKDLDLELLLEERCVHKSWKTRINGYEEAIKLFDQLDGEASEWNLFTDIIKNFIVDSNVVAQEKGLEATLVFVKKSVTAGRVVGDIMTGLITKCYGSPRTKTKDVAIQITLMFIEIENQDIVLEELVNGMNHKFPKIVSTCIRAATQAIREFGTQVLNIKILLSKLQSILEIKDKSVRDEAKLLAVEISSWIGFISVKNNLANLKSLQTQEIETEISKISNDNKPKPTRFLRSQQKQIIIAEEPTIDNEVFEENNKVIDLSQEVKEEHGYSVNILDQLENNFYEKLESKSWQERKEAINMLEGILSKASRLESGEYGDLVRALMKIIIKDTNVTIVSIAVNCITMLSNGLSKQFVSYANFCVPVLFEKFKEKKQIVTLSLRNAVDSIYSSMTFESVYNDILTVIDNKNPYIKAEAILFLARCFAKCSPTILNQKYLKIFTSALKKTLNESDPTVRNNSAEALGVAWTVVSEKNILPYLNDVDSIKLTKIKEAAKEVVIPKKSMVVIKESRSKFNFSPCYDTEKSTTNMISNNSMPRKLHSNEKFCNNDTKKFIDPSSDIKSLTTNVIFSFETEKDICDDELYELALTFCSSDIINGLTDLNWKSRLINTQKYFELIDRIEPHTISSLVLIKLLTKKSSVKESNIQVQKLKLECLKKIIEKFPITRVSMEYCLQDIFSLLGDNKNGKLAIQVLTLFVDSTSLDLVANMVLEYAFNTQKVPTVQIEVLSWFSNAILEFGFIIKPKPLMQILKKVLNDSIPKVRMSVISLLGVMYLYMGPALSLFFENEKPTLVQQINAEFKKHQGKIPPKPTKGKIKESTEPLKITNDDIKPSDELNIPNIVSRVDITQIADTFISELSDEDWKVRSEALVKLENAIREIKFITSDLGDVRKPLQDRINDSNARVSSKALCLVELISKSMGSPFKNYIKCFLPGVLNALGDSKTFRCQSARQCMNTWADVCGYREFFLGDILLDAFKCNSVILRCELWTWLAEKLPIISPKIIPVDELKSLLPYLYASFEDRNASIRSSSEKAILGFMLNLGYESMYKYSENLKLTSIKLCREKLEKEKLNLPVVPVDKSICSIKPKLKVLTPKSTTKVNKSTTLAHASLATKKMKENTEKLFQQNNLKHQRHIEEQKLKTLKWNFSSPREEYVKQLQEQMITAGVNKTLINNMFHSDFRNHLKAINTLLENLNTADDNHLSLINNLDLILKWISLKFFDTNTSVLLRSLDYLQNMFNILVVRNYSLHDTEASSFVPYLVTKLGDSKDTVRNNVKTILNQIALIFSSKKIFQYIMDGVKSKNSRQRSECLEHMAKMIEDFGTSIYQPNIVDTCKEIARSIGDRDNSVRTAALNCLVTMYFIHGDTILKFVNNISEKNMDLLKERFKRASKNRIVPVATTQTMLKNISPFVRQMYNIENIVEELNSSNEEYNATLGDAQHSLTSNIGLSDNKTITNTPELQTITNPSNINENTTDFDSQNLSSNNFFSFDIDQNNIPATSSFSEMHKNVSNANLITNNEVISPIVNEMLKRNIEFGDNYKSYSVEDNSSLHSYKSRRNSISFVIGNNNTNYEPQMKRYALDETFIKELEAEEIKTPKLELKPYHWSTDLDEEIHFQKPYQSLHSNQMTMTSYKPYTDANPNNTATITKNPESPPDSLFIDSIKDLINQVASYNIKTSIIAQKKLNNMLILSNTRSMFLENGKVLMLFNAIIKQFDILSKSQNTDTTEGYNTILNLCLTLYKYQEFTLNLHESILRDLLTKLLYLLSMNGTINEETKINMNFSQNVNSVIINVLERSSYTSVTCALLTMFYDTVKYAQSFLAYYKELVMKCLWKIIKDFPKWSDELNYDLVLTHVYKFLKEFDLKYWEKQSSDAPLKTYKTILYTMVMIDSNKVLESLTRPEFPEDSDMVVYVHKVLKHFNEKSKSDSQSKQKYLSAAM